VKKCKSIVLITALILSLVAAACGRPAHKAPSETLHETAENAGTIEEIGTDTASPAGISEGAGTDTASPAAIAEEAGADAVFPAGNSEEVAAVILHTNDVHVGLEENIGYDGLALYKKEVEALYDHVLLVDAGDAIQGAAIGAMSKGEEIIKIMNRLGYDLAVPGNHEFDFGFDVLDDCSEKLDCGYTCANFCTIDGEPVFKPWRILEAGNLKIGFVGTVTPDTFTRSAIKNIVNEVGQPMYDFLADETGERLAGALQKSINEVRDHGADYVILVAHLGKYTANTSIFSSSAIVGMLNGVDMVVDGHSHEVYNTSIPDKDGNPVPIAQTGTKMQNIGQLTIYKDGHLEENLIDLVPESSGLPEESVTRKNMERYVDPDMKAFIDEIIASYDGVMSRKIGDLSVDLIKRDENGNDLSRTGENGLCELAADAFRSAGKTQAALIGAGTVRTNLEAGEVTYKDVVDILPYCNEVIMTEVSGQMLLDALEFGVSFLPDEAGAFPQVSGITFRINKDIESRVRINEKKQFLSVDGEYRVSDVKVDGKDLDPEAIYTLAISDYLFTGGDGYTMFENANIISSTKLPDNEVVMKYIEEDLNGVIPEKYAGPQGRILD
jgi:2',3'-cyclic-nucleotide 2'-phosphodiesterase (5'-nucleotidase family)